jgi:hypothetical protein
VLFFSSSLLVDGVLLFFSWLMVFFSSSFLLFFSWLFFSWLMLFFSWLMLFFSSVLKLTPVPRVHRSQGGSKRKEPIQNSRAERLP